jgi:hypothetical protein
MQYRRTHLERVSYALMKQLDNIRSKASSSSILHKVTFHVRQARIFIRYTNTPFEVPYPMSHHIPKGDMFAPLPIQFKCLGLDYVEARVYENCQRFPSFASCTSPYTSPASSFTPQSSTDISADSATVLHIT